jgi:hypothetical protein
MQVTLKNRETLSGVVTINTIPVDVSRMGLTTLMLVVYSISGSGSPTITIQLQTSNDMETWVDCGSSFNRTSAGETLDALQASADGYQRYLRASIALTGTGPLVSYSLWANLFQGS